MWTKRLRAVDFTLGYEVRSVGADPASKPAVIAETQLAAVHIEEQRLVRLSEKHRGTYSAGCRESRARARCVDSRRRIPRRSRGIRRSGGAAR